MYPACLRVPVTAGLDGIRLSEGRRRDAQSIYRAVDSDNTSGWISPGYLVRHHVLFTLAMPLTFPYRHTLSLANSSLPLSERFSVQDGYTLFF